MESFSARFGLLIGDRIVGDLTKSSAWVFLMAQATSRSKMDWVFSRLRASATPMYMMENSLSASSASRARMFLARMADFSWLVRLRPLLMVDADMTDSPSSVELGSGVRTMFRISRSTNSRYAWIADEIDLDR